MKKIATLCLLVISIAAFAQETPAETIDNPKNEFKVNAFNLIALNLIDVSYEHLKNEETSFGVSVQFNVSGDSEWDTDYYRSFGLTGFYRKYFSKKYAKGFFVEGFGMLNSGKDDYHIYDYDTDSLTLAYDDSYTDFALGVSIGGKWATRGGFVMEVFGGAGRNLFNETGPDVVGRGGVSLGYRF